VPCPLRRAHDAGRVLDTGDELERDVGCASLIPIPGVHHKGTGLSRLGHAVSFNGTVYRVNSVRELIPGQGRQGASRWVGSQRPSSPSRGLEGAGVLLPSLASTALVLVHLQNVASQNVAPWTAPGRICDGSTRGGAASERRH
jgi:hypothetical protein